MKNHIFQIVRKSSLAAVVVLLTITGCIREDGELEPATFPADGDVFTDTFGGGIDFLAYGESKLTAFDVDTDVKKFGTTSMRFEVPDADDPEGNFAGGILAIVVGEDENGDKIVGGGRDLTGYNVLSLWAKSSIPASIGVVGFGNGFEAGSEFVAGRSNVAVNSNWKKIYIPLPDPSVLVQEPGLFELAAGAIDDRGYTLWIDEVKFEYLETIGASVKQPLDLQVVVDVDGIDITVNAGIGYFDASDFNLAPTPTKSQADVISIFSDAYDNVPVTFFNGYWEPWQTTESAEFEVFGDNIIKYTNFNFVGTEFPVIDVSSMTHIHLDFFVPGTVPEGTQLQFLIKDFGADKIDGGGDDITQTYVLTDSDLVSDGWYSVDIPLNTTRTNVGQFIYSNENGSALGGFWVDNIYFHK